jgi:hypothetical protein
MDYYGTVMQKAPTILDIFNDAWGDKPSHVVSASRTLSGRDLERLLDAWRRGSAAVPMKRAEVSEIWPLISHHTYDGRTLFGPGAGTSILPRILTILLAHDGIVAADPIADLNLLASHGSIDEALARLQDVLDGLAKTEPLIENDILRFTEYRPQLSEKTRYPLLEFFGLDPALRVFTNFLEAAVTVEEMPSVFEQEYRPQVLETLSRVRLAATACTKLQGCGFEHKGPRG